MYNTAMPDHMIHTYMTRNYIITTLLSQYILYTRYTTFLHHQILVQFVTKIQFILRFNVSVSRSTQCTRNWLPLASDEESVSSGEGVIGTVIPCSIRMCMVTHLEIVGDLHDDTLSSNFVYNRNLESSHNHTTQTLPFNLKMVLYRLANILTRCSIIRENPSELHIMVTTTQSPVPVYVNGRVHDSITSMFSSHRHI